MDIFEKFALQNMDWLMTTVWLGWVSIILLDRSTDRLDRVGFAATFGVVVLVVVLSMTSPAAFIFSYLGSAPLVRVIIFVFSVAVFVNACVQRSRDIGYDRWIALLVLLPGINILALLVLLFWAGTPRERGGREPANVNQVPTRPVTLRPPPPRH